MANHRMTGLLFALFILPGLETKSAKLKDDLNYFDFIESNMEPETKIGDRSQNLESDVEDSLWRQRRQEVPHHQDGVITVISNITDTYTSNNWTSHCIPRKALMRTPQTHPFHTFGWYLPSMIEVQRCMGGCSPGLHPDTLRCAVTKLERKTVKVMQFPFQTHKTITITNHLACQCDCRILPKDCDPVNQIYMRDFCSCECRSNIKCHSLQKLNKQNCKCECKYPEHTCSNPVMEWSRITCKCACKNPPHNCTITGMGWNPKACRCECMKTFACTTGFVFNTATCRCERPSNSTVGA